MPPVNREKNDSTEKRGRPLLNDSERTPFQDHLESLPGIRGPGRYQHRKPLPWSPGVTGPRAGRGGRYLRPQPSPATLPSYCFSSTKMAAAALGPAPSLAPGAPRYWLAPEAAQADWAAWKTVARVPRFASGGFLNGRGAGKRRGDVLGEEGGQSVL